MIEDILKKGEGILHFSWITETVSDANQTERLTYEQFGSP